MVADASDTICLPKGGGAVQGIGEKLSPDLFTSTGKFTVPGWRMENLKLLGLWGREDVRFRWSAGTLNIENPTGHCTRRTSGI
jgi:hypothetical protein